MTQPSPSQTVRQIFQRALAAIEEHQDELGKLDAVAGDGDHGITMVRGLKAANDALGTTADAPPGQLLVTAGMAFSDAAGGASGALFGMWFSTIGQKIGDGPFDTAHVHQAMRAALDTVMKLGKTQPGDKTFIDTLDPFVAALDTAAQEGKIRADAWRSALPEAETGAASTAEMVARRGRSSKHGERSLGHCDPGAVSMLYILRAVGNVFDEYCVE